MNPVNVVNQYYLEYGDNEMACAKAYLRIKNTGIARKIRKIAVYYPVMNRGGVQRVLSLLLPLYENMEYNIVLITEEISTDDYDIPVTIKRCVIPRAKNVIDGIISYKERAEGMAQIFQAEEIDLFMHHGVRNSLFVYDMLLANLMGIYTVAEKHQVFTQGFCEIHDLFFMHNEIFRIVDRLVVLSSTEEQYWKSLGINASYIENPFNWSLAEFQHNNTKNENIVWVGRLDIDSKQYLDVLEIAAFVLDKRPLAKFVMYGSGNQATINQLEQEICERGLGEHVFFYGYETDVRRIYENARIHLVTSAYEAFPMGIYESRICGIPLVMYNLPYLELLKENKGYLASANGDTNDMAKNICMILENEELERTLQLEAKESLECFSNDTVCKKWKKLFEEIENGRKEDANNDVEFGVIIQTMHKHFSIAQKKYETLLWKTEQERVVFYAKKKLAENKKLVICPYGMVGKKVKRMLNEKGIEEDYIVDNILSKHYSQIKSLEDIRKMDCSNMFFVICSEREDIKQLFHDLLSKITAKENIIYYDKAIE